ncbi:MAG: TIGR04282 family arsenosugar biosynthesis glycosyltransferase [Kiloniellaceae bacterium]
MRPARHLIIMARAPRLGAVKRRLARDVGALAAWRFYRLTAAAVVRRLARDPRWRTRLAVTPDRAARCRFWRTPDRVIGQGRGDLGARMGRILRALPPGPAVIVGSDIPDLAAAHVARAFRLLGSHDWVLGPAADGGYWLVGARRRRLPRDPFAGVRWSSAHALADTVANLARARIAYLEELDDIDTGTDLARYRESK